MSSGDLWVFGYGSLMWRPGFAYAEAQRARIVGYHRGFCIYSTHHRGDAVRPGLVLGLDRGGACDGIAFRVEARLAVATLGYLRAREQINGVYREATVEAHLGDGSGRTVHAVAFVVERAHPSYAGALPVAVQAAFIRGARGISGANVDYLVNTIAHLQGLGIAEPGLGRVMALIGGYFRHRDSDGDRVARPRSATLMRCCRWPSPPVRRMRKGERRRFGHRLQIDAQRTAQRAPS